jgi:hypothetical protein
MKTLLNTGLVLLLLVSCKSYENKDVSGAMTQNTTNLLASRNFEIILDWANPLMSNDIDALGLLPLGSSSGRIDLAGNSNYMLFKGDSLEVSLPYYGTRYSGATTVNNHGGIEFKGEPMNYRTSYDEKKHRTRISFDMKEDTESYDVSIEIYPSKRSYVNINSSQRSSISYDGTVKALKED